MEQGQATDTAGSPGVKLGQCGKNHPPIAYLEPGTCPMCVMLAAPPVGYNRHAGWIEVEAQGPALLRFRAEVVGMQPTPQGMATVMRNHVERKGVDGWTAVPVVDVAPEAPDPAKRLIVPKLVVSGGGR